MTSTSPELATVLEPLLGAPQTSAVLTDVDGTIAPIAPTPEQAEVPERSRALLEALAGRYALVACVSGRPAAGVREMVGSERITYIGNHGCELLKPGASEPVSDPALADCAVEAQGFAAGLDHDRLKGAGIRIEDKGPIVALHWRDCADEAAAEKLVAEIGAAAESAGLRTHRGRKVLELRPDVEISKGVALRRLLEGSGVEGALYAGDDRTDLDGFEALRDLRDAGKLSAIVCVAIASAETPPEVIEGAELVVEGPRGMATILEALAAA